MKKIKTATQGLVIACLLALGLAVGCNQYDSDSLYSGGGNSKGGSMARFTIVGDYMYTVDGNMLHVVSLSIPDKPFEVGEISVGSQIETIFPMADKLFIGSQSSMFIYDISSPEEPYELGRATHFTSCDPVVASGHYAFVTLNSARGEWCGNTGANTLQVYDITNLQKPVLRQSKNLYSPGGLAVDGEAGLVFVCDGGGVITYKIEITPPDDEETGEKINLTRSYSTSGIEQVRGMNAYDCIVLNGTLIVTGDDGIYQMSYNQTGFSFISKIDLR
jgi:hypothetical protein